MYLHNFTTVYAGGSAAQWKRVFSKGIISVQCKLTHYHWYLLIFLGSTKKSIFPKKYCFLLLLYRYHHFSDDRHIKGLPTPYEVSQLSTFSNFFYQSFSKPFLKITLLSLPPFFLLILRCSYWALSEHYGTPWCRKYKFFVSLLHFYFT